MAKDNVLWIEPMSFGSAEKELWAICIWPGICHRKDAWSSVLQLEVFIGELFTVDWLSTSSIVLGKVATLAHESGNDSVERGALVAITWKFHYFSKTTKMYLSPWCRVGGSFQPFLALHLCAGAWRPCRAWSRGMAAALTWQRSQTSRWDSCGPWSYCLIHPLGHWR